MVSSRLNMSLWHSKRERQMLTYRAYVKWALRCRPRSVMSGDLVASAIPLQQRG